MRQTHADVPVAVTVAAVQPLADACIELLAGSEQTGEPAVGKGGVATVPFRAEKAVQLSVCPSRGASA